MGLDDAPASTSDFNYKIPPAFKGRGDYASYREDVRLWVKLTGLETPKRGPALVARLSGEAKESAHSLSIDNICCDNGVESVLVHLDQS